MVIVTLIPAAFVISLISFSCDAEAQTFSDNRSLLNVRGEVMGVSSASFSCSPGEFAGISFGVPSNIITKVVPALITTGSYTHPYIAITGIDITSEIEEAILLQETRDFLITDVTAEGPTANAGIEDRRNFLADINGNYIEVGRIINIPRNIPDNSNSSSDILTYQNSPYGISIQYPANWTIDEQDVDPNDTITNIVSFISPLESSLDIYSENLGIGFERLADQNMTLEEYATSLITDYNETLTDFHPIESNTNITLGGGNNPAYGLVYTDREDNINYKMMEIGTIIGDRVYYIEYIAEEKNYSNYLPTIQMMINSLEIS